MKPHSFLCKALFAAFILLGFCSCTQVSETGSYAGYDDSSAWVSQLDAAIESGKDYGRSDLKLVGYSHRGNITSQEDLDEILLEIFDDEAIIAVGEKENPNFFKVGELKKTAQPSEEGNKEVISIREIVATGTDIIDLTWKCKGKVYRSVAIASDTEGILYDNIGLFVMDSSQKKEYSGPKRTTTTRSEPQDSALVNREVSWSVSDERYNLLHIFLYSYMLYCNSTFDGHGIWVDAVLGAEHKSSAGWSCDAEIRTVGGEKNITKYHDFAWAYAYGSGTAINIGFDGLSFTIPRGSTGASGTISHTINDLAFDNDSTVAQ